MYIIKHIMAVFPKLKKLPKVVTVHDLIHEKFHEYYGMPENF